MLTETQLLRLANFDQELADALGPAMGGIHFADPGTETEVVTQNVYVKAGNASTLHEASGFDQPIDNRLRYLGTRPARAMIVGTLSFVCAANNELCGFSLAHNGVVSVPSIITGKYQSGTDVQSITVMSHPTLEPGDYVELWVANLTSAANITVVHGHLHALAFYP